MRGRPACFLDRIVVQNIPLLTLFNSDRAGPSGNRSPDPSPNTTLNYNRNRNREYRLHYE